MNKIYIITTPRNGHRAYSTIRDIYLHFKESSIQICCGVDKHTIKIKDDIAYTDGNHFGKITEINLLRDPGFGIGHLACNMSHTNIIHDALINDYDMIMVAEDDLLLGRRCGWVLEKAMECVPENWELLRLSWFPSPGIDVQEYNKYRYTGKGIRGTELYLINKKGIKKLYDNLNKGSRASFDFQLHEFTDIHQYIIKYSLGIQRNNYDLDINISEKNGTYSISDSGKEGYVINKHTRQQLLGPALN